MQFLSDLKIRNEVLWYFSLICLLLAGVYFVLSFISQTKVLGVNAWYKPLKFALSIAIYSMTMAWYCFYLKDFNLKLFNWSVVVLLGFEIIYIAIQAAKGELSHFNISTPVYAILYNCMAIAATLVSIYTAYITYLFFVKDLQPMPDYYLWSIRLGLLIFVVFSFQGFTMGARLNHSVGALNDNSNLFVLGWSKTVGDLRVAHFIGMHSLQVLPILSYYVLKNTKLTFVFAAIYFALAAYTLIQAFKAKPFISISSSKSEVESQSNNVN